MKTSEKLLKAFQQFRPHINGHRTAMELFFEAVKEVEDKEQSEQLRIGGVVVPKGALCECDDEDDTIPMRWICTNCNKEWKP